LRMEASPADDESRTMDRPEPMPTSRPTEKSVDSAEQE